MANEAAPVNIAAPVESAAPAVSADNGANGSGQGQAPAPANAGGSSPQTWRDSLPADLKADPSIAGFKDLGDLAKSYIHAASMVGRDKVVVPTDKSTKEEWDAFHAKIGRPESPDKYGVKLEGVPEDVSKSFLQKAFDLGLNKKHVAEIIQWNDTEAKKQVETQRAQQQAKEQNVLRDYKAKVGGEERFASRVEIAREAMYLTADKEVIEMLHSTGLGSDPRFIEYFAKLGERMKEDGIKGHGGVSFGSQLSELEDEYAKVMDPSSPYWIQGHPQKDAMMQKSLQLSEQIERAKSKMR